MFDKWRQNLYIYMLKFICLLLVVKVNQLSIIQTNVHYRKNTRHRIDKQIETQTLLIKNSTSNISL